MDYNQAFAISAAGMDVERRRLDVAALNLANANTVAGTDGHLYQPLRVVAHAAQIGARDFDDMVAQGLDAVPVATVETATTTPRMVYEPGHPMADERGFVSYPGVDTATEMLTIMSAMRSYEANVAAMTAVRAMTLKALDIGG
jgi:flagellar basal-body rod protein FlgC